MACINRCFRNQCVRVRQIVGSGNVKAGFIPEKRQAQQRRMEQKNRHKDQRKDVRER
jgi:hypothetical protein